MTQPQPVQPKPPQSPKNEVKPLFYPCIFNLTNHCPVRDHYKLRPESMALFCPTCPVMHKAKKEMEYEIMHGEGLANPSGRV